MSNKIIKDKSFPRITLALDIIKRLEEGPYAGYHELRTVKHQLDLADDLKVTPSKDMGVICDYKNVPTDESNLCWKAATLLRKKFNIKDNVQIKINKRISVQGGLAGGSTNAAKVMEMLNELWELSMSQEDMIEIGRQVGMDVPFYFIGGTAYDTETTGVLKSIQTDLNKNFILVIPNFGISTKDAFQAIDYTRVGKDMNKTEKMIKALRCNDVAGVAENMHNDFEIHLFKSFPQLLKIKNSLIRAGCMNAVLTGSGSTIIGLVKDKLEAVSVEEVFKRKAFNCQVKIVQSLSFKS